VAGSSDGSFTVTISPLSGDPASAGLPLPGGPAQFSPNGVVADVQIIDALGNPVTLFDTPITLVLHYTAADLAMAHGDPSLLTAAYLLDPASPDLENPLHFPSGTWLFFPPSLVHVDPAAGTVTVQTQALGSIVALFANPAGYVQTLAPATRLFSSWDPATSAVLASKPQYSWLRVIEPQIGSRLYVVDVDSNGLAFVNAADVGPSGPPSPRPAPAPSESVPEPRPAPTPSAVQPAPAAEAPAEPAAAGALASPLPSTVNASPDTSIAASASGASSQAAAPSLSTANASPNTSAASGETTSPSPSNGDAGPDASTAPSQATDQPAAPPQVPVAPAPPPASSRIATAGYSQVTLLDGRLLVVGGTAGGATLATAQLYDPASGAWTSTGAMSQPRTDATAVVLDNGTVLVAGGADNGVPLVSAEVFDPFSGRWYATSSMVYARRGATGRLLDDGQVLVEGGGSDPAARPEVFTPGAGIWSLAG
jgi:hypothetical protein